MFLNTGFTFKNTKGTYTVGKQPKTEDDVYFGVNQSTNERMIIPTYEFGSNTIYTNTDTDDESVVLQFAGINIFKDKEIIDFCNKYGPLYTESIESDKTNDYLFIAGCDSFPKPASTIGGNCIPVYSFQRSVIMMRKIIMLYEALNSKDIKTIISILVWFCFDASDGYDDDALESNYESMRFNEYYRDFVDGVSDEYEPAECQTLTQKIKLFLNALEDDVRQKEISGSTNNIRHYISMYPDMDHCTWQHFHDLFSRLLEKTEVLSIDPLGDITLSSELSDEDIHYIACGEENVLLLGKAFISDYFSDILTWVHPDMTFENGQFLPNLRISSLEQAMYVELFFKITPYTTIRKCANPTCNAFFEVSSENSKRLYCSTRCAQLMAKRKQREREKQYGKKEVQ